MPYAVTLETSDSLQQGESAASLSQNCISFKLRKGTNMAVAIFKTNEMEELKLRLWLSTRPRVVAYHFLRHIQLSLLLI